MNDSTMKVENILMSLIDRPAVPDRLSIDPEYIKELAASINAIGLMNPIVLCPRGSRYEVVAGDCRYQAFLSLGRFDIPAVIKDVDAENVAVMRATENLQRKDLSVVEEAQIYKRLHDELNMTWDQIAKQTGKSAGVVHRRYDILRMPEILIKAIHEKKIGYTVAEELADLKDIGRIEYYLGFCIDHGATQAVVRDWVNEERARQRQEAGVNVEGAGGPALYESKPIYVSCDICVGPMEIKKVVSLRICPACADIIRTNMKGV